jgi:hypothetical protein
LCNSLAKIERRWSHSLQVGESRGGASGPYLWHLKHNGLTWNNGLMRALLMMVDASVIIEIIKWVLWSLNWLDIIRSIKLWFISPLKKSALLPFA